MVPPPSDNKPLLIPGYRHITDAQLIIRLEGDGNYTLIHVRDAAQPLLVSYTLKYFQLQLPQFIRVSKSALVNPGYIDRVVKTGPKRLFLLLIDGTTIPVSRRRIVYIRQRLGIPVR